jgi:hypothetical protein
MSFELVPSLGALPLSIHIVEHSHEGSGWVGEGVYHGF